MENGGDTETVVNAKRRALQHHFIIPFRVIYISNTRVLHSPNTEETFEQAKIAPTRSHKGAPSPSSFRMAIVKDKPELKRQQPRAKEETEHAPLGRTRKYQKESKHPNIKNVAGKGTS